MFLQVQRVLIKSAQLLKGAICVDAQNVIFIRVVVGESASCVLHRRRRRRRLFHFQFLSTTKVLSHARLGPTFEMLFLLHLTTMVNNSQWYGRDGGGQVVAFYSDDPSLNPAEDLRVALEQILS